MKATPLVNPLPDEPCGPPEPPTAIPYPQLIEPNSEGRLIAPLRLVAQLRDGAGRPDPLTMLISAAELFHGQIGTPPEKRDLTFANAFADLAVTGRGAYGELKNLPPEAAIVAMTAARLPSPVVSTVARAVSMALDRAYAVAWALRGPVAQRAALRAVLGWIAVSGEDDRPHRPVNVPTSSRYEQYELPVDVGAVGPVQTRFIIAPAVAGPPSAPIPPMTRALPPDPVPHIRPGHQVILFLHGDSSGAEEALDLIPAIHAAGLRYGTKYAVVSLDLPSCGYSESFDHTRVAPSSATTYPGGIGSKTPIATPLLDYIEDFVVAFVRALDAATGIRNRFAGVIGGSLGGNLGLRLGRSMSLDGNPWFRAGIVSWDAASVWPAKVEDPIASAESGHCQSKWLEPETPGSRTDHFHEVYDTPVVPPFVPTQPEMWYRDTWPCRPAHIQSSRLARREVYDVNLRQWHWRVSCEQLIYSHIDRVVHGDATTKFRYELNTVRQLLVAGQKDDFIDVNIYSRTRDLADLMVGTPGTSLFLEETGHSVHFERPKFLAGEIVKFLTTAPKPPASGLALLRRTPGWATIPVAAKRNGGWAVTNEGAGDFVSDWVTQPDVQVVPGDFHGTGRNGFALVRQSPGWSTIPVAFLGTDGQWAVSNHDVGEFAAWAAEPGVQVVAGDFDGNGLTDIALVRQTAGWSTIPVALAQGDGTWAVSNLDAGEFVSDWATQPGVKVISGAFGGTGRADIALVRQTPGWSTMPVAFSKKGGTWRVTNGGVSNPDAGDFIADWATRPGVRVVTGNFDSGVRTDIALVRQTAGWTTIPVAFSDDPGGWIVSNGPAPEFCSWATEPGVKVVTGDFDGDGLTDIALVRQTPGWSTVPVAFANGDGTWTVTNAPAPGFSEWATQPGVQVVAGDFDGDGLADIALVRQTPGWATIPVAVSKGDGTWSITNGAAPEFSSDWATLPGVEVLGGDFEG